MVKKTSIGSLTLFFAGVVLALSVSGCVVAKDTYQAEVVRANDLEAKSEDLEFRLREKSETERKIEKKLGEAEARAVEADKKIKVAQAATEEARTSLAACGKEKDALGADIEALKKSARSLDEQLAQQKARIKEAEERSRETKAAGDAQLSRQSANIEQMRSRIADLTAERDVLTEKLAKLGDEKKEKLDELSKGYEELLSTMQSEISLGQVVISKLKGQLSVKFLDEILFPSGGAEIKPEGKKLLATLAKALKLEADKIIQIEGHTDNVKIGGALAEKYPSNWELSSARAVAVVRYLAEKEGIDGNRLAAAGFGEFAPIADNQTKEGRQKNRRIEIKLLPVEAKAEDAKKAEEAKPDAPAQTGANPPADARAEDKKPVEQKTGEAKPGDEKSPAPNPAEAKPVQPGQ